MASIGGICKNTFHLDKEYIYEGMPVYKNKPEKQPKLNTVTNGHVTETKMELDLHTGTHADSPLHMKRSKSTGKGF